MSARTKPMEMTSELLSGPGAASAPPDPPRRAVTDPMRVPPAMPELPEPEEDIPRRTVSVRLSVATIDRLREYTHRRRLQKQDVVEVAVARFLAGEGF